MKLLKKIIKYTFLFFFVSTVSSVILLRFVPVYITPLMLIRSVQNMSRGESPTWYHQWVPLNEISHWLPQAVVASEDKGQ